MPSLVVDSSEGAGLCPHHSQGYVFLRSTCRSQQQPDASGGVPYRLAVSQSAHLGACPGGSSDGGGLLPDWLSNLCEAGVGVAALVALAVYGGGALQRVQGPDRPLRPQLQQGLFAAGSGGRRSGSAEGLRGSGG